MTLPPTIKRRSFLQTCAVVGISLASPLPVLAADGKQIAWRRDAKTGLFTAVSADGRSLVAPNGPGLLDASCGLAGEPRPATHVAASAGQAAASDRNPLRLAVRHRLCDSGAGYGEDVLEATLTVRNVSDRPQRIEIQFASSARPAPDLAAQHTYVPLSAAGLFGDGRFAALGVKNFLKDCNQLAGTADFTAHYLEPMASSPAERETRELLLAPVLDVFDPQRPWRVALFTPSDQPMRFSMGGGILRAGREVTVAAGGEYAQRCWLMLHQGDASLAWKAFHCFGHREEFAVPGWAHDFKVHYYDFLSSAQGEKGLRGNGYESDLPRFREFRVGLATQHGYYPAIGDYLHPDRKAWQAMRGDKQGPAEMSLEKMRARIHATRVAGAKAAVYLHAALLDDATTCFARLRDCVQVDANGHLMNFGWTGPDTAGKTWRASLAAPEWREHLLQQRTGSWISSGPTRS